MNFAKTSIIILSLSVLSQAVSADTTYQCPYAHSIKWERAQMGGWAMKPLDGWTDYYHGGRIIHQSRIPSLNRGTISLQPKKLEEGVLVLDCSYSFKDGEWGPVHIYKTVGTHRHCSEALDERTVTCTD